MGGHGPGLRRFIIGMSKKLLISSAAAAAADAAFSAGPALDARIAWLGAAAYTLQLYFDFSGYSDMALGLGRALGFACPENFNHPYAAVSITDFWRRWHISLSLWFRDYLYIPLGGSRRGKWRTALNKAVVFVLCGLWHGANLTFVVWGAWHGLLRAREPPGARRAAVAAQRRGRLLARLHAARRRSWLCHVQGGERRGRVHAHSGHVHRLGLHAGGHRPAANRPRRVDGCMLVLGAVCSAPVLERARALLKGRPSRRRTALLRGLRSPAGL
ncbi:MAG: MBOAT family O-acyltransferase [Oscillospiraceae bacterium]